MAKDTEARDSGVMAQFEALMHEHRHALDQTQRRLLDIMVLVDDSPTIGVKQLGPAFDSLTQVYRTWHALEAGWGGRVTDLVGRLQVQPRHVHETPRTFGDAGEGSCRAPGSRRGAHAKVRSKPQPSSSGPWASKSGHTPTSSEHCVPGASQNMSEKGIRERRTHPRPTSGASWASCSTRSLSPGLAYQASRRVLDVVPRSVSESMPDTDQAAAGSKIRRFFSMVRSGTLSFTHVMPYAQDTLSPRATDNSGSTSTNLEARDPRRPL